ncbi:hypothetical protein LV779_19480 [Streptomyces thinghirensis]|nr:hypothetical protein [Streptomyces thinghirensis]
MTLGPDPFTEPVRRAEPVWERVHGRPAADDRRGASAEARRGVHLAHRVHDTELEAWQRPEAKRKLRAIAEIVRTGHAPELRPPGMLWFFASDALRRHGAAARDHGRRRAHPSRETRPDTTGRWPAALQRRQLPGQPHRVGGRRGRRRRRGTGDLPPPRRRLGEPPRRSPPAPRPVSARASTGLAAADYPERRGTRRTARRAHAQVGRPGGPPRQRVAGGGRRRGPASVS